ncbi:MAG: hypothetical protein Tsb002_37460 [Wenzhouxiangellaceae bacterium]
MMKVRLLLAASLLLCGVEAGATDYTLTLKNGDNPDCNIMTASPSRVVIDTRDPAMARIVNLSEFEADNGSYSYTWSSSKGSIVAIQVDLAGFRQADVWDPRADCTYSPTFDDAHTHFVQQYQEPDTDYTCSCTSSWED